MKKEKLNLIMKDACLGIYKKIFNKRLLKKAEELLTDSQEKEVNENYKLIIKNINDNYNIVQKTNIGYIIYEFHKNNGDLSSSSIGRKYELLRLKSVEKCFECYLWYEPNIKKNSKTVKLTRNSISNGSLTSIKIEAGNQIKVVLNCNLVNIAYLSEGNNSIEIYSNDKLIKSFNTALSNKEIMTEELRYSHNTKNKEIIIKNNGVDNFEFICFNFMKLIDYNGEYVNKYLVCKSGEYFINSDGASDYAISDYDDKKWCGSYHGGESLEFGTISWSENGNVKEVELHKVKDRDFSLVKNLRLIQKTNINDKAKMLSTLNFSNDGSLTMNFKLSENKINAKIIYTALTCISPSFIVLTKPNIKIIKNKNNYINNTGYIEKYSYDFGMKIGIKYDILKDFKTDVESYIFHNMNYSKFYYGIVLNDNSVNIPNLEFNKKLYFYNLKVD